MASETYYLKYRPQSLKDLDLSDVSSSLLTLVKSKKVPHALLFTGPKGTGKTSSARILAKALDCTGRKEGEIEPCNKCDACREITAGTALDLIEIDAASNRGIDDIRNLREKIKLSPAKFKYKVYIIDEVHMLTSEAFNALLKTLEEPPAHAVFILCTTEAAKLPDTIISRCLRFNFHKASLKEIVSSLKKVAEGEKLEVEDEVLEMIGKTVDGSFRDAHKLLEQLSLEEGKITIERAAKLLRQSDDFRPERLLNLLVDRQTKEAMIEIGKVVEAGVDLVVFIQNALDSLRLALLAKVGLDDSNYPKKLDDLTVVEVRYLIRLFSQAASEMRFAPIPQLPLELAVVEFCGCPDLKKSGGGEMAKKEKAQEKGVQEKEMKKEEPMEKETEGVLPDPGISSVDSAEIVGKWPQMMAGVRPLNHSIEALLKASRPMSIEEKTLTIEVFYKFHKERLESEKCRQIVEEVGAQVFGMPLRVKCVLGKKEMTRPVADSTETEPVNTGDIINLANDIFNGKIAEKEVKHV